MIFQGFQYILLMERDPAASAAPAGSNGPFPLRTLEMSLLLRPQLGDWKY